MFFLARFSKCGYKYFVIVLFSFIYFCKKNILAYPAGIYLLKVNNSNTRARCEIFSKLTIKTLERLGIISVPK